MSMHDVRLGDLRKELKEYVKLCRDDRSMGAVDNVVTVNFFAEWAKYLLDLLERMDVQIEKNKVSRYQ